MVEMTPVTREEMYLAKAGGQDIDVPIPVLRVEMFLAKIAGEDVNLPTPVTRLELFLAALAGEDVDLPTPITRLEQFLAKAAGDDIEVPTPITRIEQYLMGIEGGRAVLLTYTGNLPATITAVAHAIYSLTRYGLCTQESASTPSTPKDIVCNNGAIKYGALGQNLLDPSAANTMLGYYINRTDGEVKDSPYNFMFAGYMPVEAGKTYVAYGRAKNGNDLSDYNRVAWYDSTKTWIAGANYTQNQIAVVTAPNNAAYARFSCNPSGGTSVAVTQAIVDSYNWMFAEGTAEITPFVPFVGGTYVDGTPEVLWIDDGNKMPPNAVADVLYPVSGSGSCIVSCDVNNGSNVLAVEVHYYKADRTQINYYTLSSYDDATHRMYKSFSLPATAAYVSIERKSAYSTATVTNLKLAMGATLTPYVTPQTATVADLFAVGDYADTQEIIGGQVTRKCGIYVCDGTESVFASGAGWAFAITDKLKSKVAVLCTHYSYSSATMANAPDKSIITFSSQNVGIKDSAFTSKTDVTDFFAAQYAAGTPVIVLYPLAEETTEQVTPQTLHTVDGDNVVDSTANVSPVEAQIEYYGTEGN